jgi:hypothetical protein
VFSYRFFMLHPTAAVCRFVLVRCAGERSGSGGGGGGISSPLCNAGASWSISFRTNGATCSPDAQDDVTGQASSQCSAQCNATPGDFNAVSALRCAVGWSVCGSACCFHGLPAADLSFPPVPSSGLCTPPPPPCELPRPHRYRGSAFAPVSRTRLPALV